MEIIGDADEVIDIPFHSTCHQPRDKVGSYDTNIAEDKKSENTIQVCLSIAFQIKA
jgi:hypothetical protein